MRTEEEVDEMIEDMKRRTKGRYITQACSFNKDCPRQMYLLKKALMSSVSFSGLVKEMLSHRFTEPTNYSVVGNGYGNITNSQFPTDNVSNIKPEEKKTDFGNFL